MMYVERNDGHDTPQSYVRRNLTRPQSLLQYQRITGRFFAVSSTEADVMFYSRCNFPMGQKVSSTAFSSLIQKARREHGTMW
jgi:hypothetical protein